MKNDFLKIWKKLLEKPKISKSAIKNIKKYTWGLISQQFYKQKALSTQCEIDKTVK